MESSTHESGHDLVDLSMPTLAADLVAVISEFKNQKHSIKYNIVLVGHSLGGGKNGSV